jgi:hypothetical protein
VIEGGEGRRRNGGGCWRGGWVDRIVEKKLEVKGRSRKCKIR